MTDSQGGITITRKQAVIGGALLFVLLAAVVGGGVAMYITRSTPAAPAVVSAPITGNSPSGRYQQIIDAANRSDGEAFLSFFTPRVQQGYRQRMAWIGGPDMASFCRQLSKNGTIRDAVIYDETIIGTVARVRALITYTDGKTNYDISYFNNEGGTWYINAGEDADARAVERTFAIDPNLFPSLIEQARKEVQQ